ncbi:hypothetical protein VNO78_06644 [Psophocarpus tetragonolobus]|uniref:Retrovirus-related Pol polyprotein from transposon TNT 1-94 n=1 Tax=Psophocarpus tetragonolobus TaxID=3891 RepID=A0AAN9T2C2_PSOTE
MREELRLGVVVRQSHASKGVGHATGIGILNSNPVSRHDGANSTSLHRGYRMPKSNSLYYYETGHVAGYGAGCVTEPEYFEEALESEEKQQWLDEMEDEMKSLHDNRTYDLSPSNEAEKLDMEKVPYASAMGSLMYAMLCTRPNIAHAVGTVSRFLSNPSREHWRALKWILRYLHGTIDKKLCLGGDKPILVGYSNSDMGGDIDSRRSTSGYLIKFAGGAVAWQSKLQKCIALSTTETEFIAITEACKELLWLKKFLQEFGFVQDSYSLLVDNQSFIHLGKNSTFHSKSKHIDVRYHWIHDVLDAKLLELGKVHTDDNDADMMTKALPRGKFEVCCEIADLAGHANYVLAGVGLDHPNSKAHAKCMIGGTWVGQEDESHKLHVQSSCVACGSAIPNTLSLRK